MCVCVWCTVQVRHLLHAAEFSKQQRLLSLVKLLGELYNDLVVDSKIIFDALYTFLSQGSDTAGAMPDASGDHFRVRLVCTMLDTCGHYFDHGAPRRRLDLFLAHFQRYLLLKAPLPMDIEYTVSDSFEALRPDLQRLTSLELADAVLARTEAELRQGEVFGLF